jgi:hypothetical protein
MDVPLDWKSAAVLVVGIFGVFTMEHIFGPIPGTASEKPTVKITNNCGSCDRKSSLPSVQSGSAGWYVSPNRSDPPLLGNAAQNYDTVEGLQGIPTKGNQQGALPHWAAPAQIKGLNGVSVN